MGIRVETMKFHALAEPSRVEAMADSMLEKVPFHAGSKNLDMFPLTNGLESDEAKSG